MEYQVYTISLLITSACIPTEKTDSNAKIVGIAK